VKKARKPRVKKEAVDGDSTVEGGGGGGSKKTTAKPRFKKEGGGGDDSADESGPKKVTKRGGGAAGGGGGAKKGKSASATGGGASPKKIGKQANSPKKGSGKKKTKNPWSDSDSAGSGSGKSDSDEDMDAGTGVSSIPREGGARRAAGLYSSLSHVPSSHPLMTLPPPLPPVLFLSLKKLEMSIKSLLYRSLVTLAIQISSVDFND